LLLACKGGGEQSSAATQDGTNTIVIGQCTPLTGPNALLGEMAERGLRLAIQEINSKGGINGKQLELVVYDDQGTPEGAVKAVTRLVEVDKVTAVVGSFLSPNVISSAYLTEDAEILHIGCGTSAAWTNAGYKFLFRGTANSNLNVASFVDIMVNEMGAKRAAVITVQTDYGQTCLKDVEKNLAGTSCEIVANLSYQPADTDFTGQVAQIIKSTPDAVVFNGLSSEIALFLRQLRQMGYTGYVYNSEAGANNDAMAVAGESANNLIFTSAYIVPTSVDKATSEEMRYFLTKYQGVYNALPTNDVAYRGWDSMNLLAEALKNVSDLSNRVAIRDAFLKITNFNGIAGVYNFSDGSGDGLAASNRYMIIGGAVQTFDKSKLK
jgi:branched-chain amino acid transport system substrate-binding protein